MNVYINLRDELIVLETDEIAYVKANSNYSDIHYIKGGKKTLAMTIAKIEDLIKASTPNGSKTSFARIGRSLLINQKYLVHIDMLRKTLQLDDYNGHSCCLSVSKTPLKEYKNRFAKNQ